MGKAGQVLSSGAGGSFPSSSANGFPWERSRPEQPLINSYSPPKQLILDRTLGENGRVEFDLHKVVITLSYTIGFLASIYNYAVELVSSNQLKVSIFHVEVPGILVHHVKHK